MPPHQEPAIPLSAVVSAMRSALKSLSERPQIPYSHLMIDTMRELASAGFPIEPENNFEIAWVRLQDKHPLAFTLIEGYEQLLTLGYIVPWPNANAAPNPDHFHITENGRGWAHSSIPVPEDSDGFMSAVNAFVPTLDTVIKQYLLEAVVTYNRRAWFASAVMVGAASEKIVYMLLESLSTVTGGSEGQAIKKIIKERSLQKIFDHIEKALTIHSKSGYLPYEVHEGCQPHLLSLFQVIRVQRNEAVHPTAGEVTPAMVRLTLAAFPSACRKVYDLINWCQHGVRTP